MGLLVRRHFFPLAIIVLAISITYSNSLHNSFQFDDLQIKERPNLHVCKLDLKSLKKVIYWSATERRLYRPIPCLTLAINYYFGRMNPFGYHLVNIGIHILCSMAVYWLIYTLLAIPSIQPRFAAENRNAISVIATFLFALHPIQTNVATYIIQRMASLEALFYVISTGAFIRLRLYMLDSSPFYKKVLWGSVSGAAGLCAILSKENAAFLPAMLLIIEILFFYESSPESQRHRLKVIYGTVIFLGLLAATYKGPPYLGSFLEGYKHRHFTLSERLLTETRIVFYYLYLLLIPEVSLLSLNHWVQISSGLLDPPQTLLALVGLAGLGVVAYVLRRRFNIFSFAILWYFGNLIIESTIVPLELIYEHRTYVPGIAVFMCMAILITYGLRKVKKPVAILPVVILLLLYANGTYIRNVIWRTEKSLWMDVVDKYPSYARAHANLGKTYLDSGELSDAERELKLAIKLDPMIREPYVNLAKLYIRKGMPGEALNMLKKLQRIGPANVWNLVTSGNVYFELKKYELAEHCYSKAISMLPFWVPAINNLGVARIHLGKLKLAERTFKYGMAVDPSFVMFYTNLAKLYANQGQYDDAVGVLKKYLCVDKNSRTALKLLKVIKQKADKSDNDGST